MSSPYPLPAHPSLKGNCITDDANAGVVTVQSTTNAEQYFYISDLSIYTIAQSWLENNNLTPYSFTPWTTTPQLWNEEHPRHQLETIHLTPDKFKMPPPPPRSPRSPPAQGGGYQQQYFTPGGPPPQQFHQQQFQQQQQQYLSPEMAAYFQQQQQQQFQFQQSLEQQRLQNEQQRLQHQQSLELQAQQHKEEMELLRQQMATKNNTPRSSTTVPELPKYTDGMNVKNYNILVDQWKLKCQGLGLVGEGKWDKVEPQSTLVSATLVSCLIEQKYTDTNATTLAAGDTSDGFKMLKVFLKLIQPSESSLLLDAAKDLGTFHMTDVDNSGTYMARAKEITTALNGADLDKLMVLMAINGVDPQRFIGIVQRFRNDDPKLVNATLASLTLEMKQEENRVKYLPPGTDNVQQDHAAAASRAGRQAAQQDINTDPPPPESTYPPGDTDPLTLPKFEAIRKLCRDWRKCPTCFRNTEKRNCHEGCPIAALEGFVVKYDPDAAAAIVEQYNSDFPDQPLHGGRGGRGRGNGGRGRGNGGRSNRRGRGRGDGAGRGGTRQPQGRRAQSSRTPSPARAPAPASPAPAQAAGVNTPAPALASPNPFTAAYPDRVDEDSSGDEAAFDERSVENNSNVESAPYSPSCTPGLLSFWSKSLGTPSTKLAKLSRKYANRRNARARRATSARFLSAEISTLTETLLHSDTSKIGLYNDKDEECCADTGATDVMLPDYAAFVSYKRVYGQYALLGDDTKLKIEGVGTAVFRLNNYVVKIRNVLHIPALRAPLYSLRSHRMQPGCGTLSSYDIGSYVIFPTFVLKIDDSTDNLISYKSLGPSYKGEIHYKQPKVRSNISTASSSSRPMKTRSQSSPVTIETETVTPIISQDEPDVSENNNEQNNETLLPTISEDNDDDISASPPPEAVSPASTTPSSTNEDSPASPTSVVEITEDELLSNTSKPLTTSTLAKLHHDPTNLPSVPPSATPAPCEHRTEFDSLKLHRIFGHRRFKNQKHITDAANAKLLHTGALPATLGSFATITNPPHGKTIKKHRRFLDKVHMDIVYGDCVSLGGYRYAIILVDVATRYCWIYGMMSLTSAEVINALQLFRADAERMPKRFHADFDKKLIGGKALKWIITNNSNIIAAPAKRQSSNGLAERTWRTIITMARAFITEKQVGRDMWYYAIRHSAMMLNQVPGRLGRKLTTPFELVHGVKPSSETWFELFSVGYFNHDMDNNESRSSSQAQTLDGIAVGRDDRSNTIIFYNPISKSYYRPPAYKLDESRLPITNFPKSIKFDGGLTCGLLRYRSQPIHEPFPPGTRVSIQQQDALVRGTIQNVPLPFTPNVASAETLNSPPPEDQSTTYTIRLDDGTTIQQGFEDLINAGRDKDSTPVSSTLPDVLEGIPSMLHPSKKVTMKHDNTYKKGIIGYSPEGGFTFLIMRNARSSKVDWSVPLPNFKQTWTTLMAEDILIPGHGTVSTLLQSPIASTTPRANFVSAKELISPLAPPSLTKALDPNNPDKSTWSASYNEEKDGLLDHDVYRSISKKEYLALKRSGKIPKAIPSMCILVVKPDKDGKPNRAKSRIVVLGNFEDRIYQKSQRYAPVLRYDSLRLLTANAVRDKRILQQGDCKNAFCNANLPDDETTVIRPPIGDPAFNKNEYWLLNKTLYGLRRSPHHWYNMVTKILTDMGLKASPHDPCLFSGILQPSTSQNDIILPPSRSVIHVGLYVDDFVFYSISPAEEELFKQLFAQHIQVDFMGDVDYFLGTAFTWKQHDSGHLSVHLCQSAFTEFTANRFGVSAMTPVPNMTPYRSGYPIDSIPQADLNDPNLKHRTKTYQAIIGCINWLSTCTRPDISPCLSFLSSYNMAPHEQHYKAAIHALKYLYSTAEYGISFHSDASSTLQSFNHFPNHHDKEAYDDATPPSPSECHELTAYSDACWGGQFGNHVKDGTPLELFKYRSLSGYLVCKSGGPISWKAERQNRTALSSCVAEIIATNECVKEVESIKNRDIDLGTSHTTEPIPIYNDNKACVQWSETSTSKGIKHVNLRENYIREAHQDKEVVIKHIPGIINPSDIFTKEMKDAAHFRRLRDCIMCSRSVFLKYHQNIPSEVISHNKLLPYYSIRSPTTPSTE